MRTVLTLGRRGKAEKTSLPSDFRSARVTPLPCRIARSPSSPSNDDVLAFNCEVDQICGLAWLVFEPNGSKPGWNYENGSSHILDLVLSRGISPEITGKHRFSNRRRGHWFSACHRPGRSSCRAPPLSAPLRSVHLPNQVGPASDLRDSRWGRRSAPWEARVSR